MPLFAYSQLIYVLTVSIIWYGRQLYLNRVIHASHKVQWRSYYYLGLSAIVILYLPDVCLFFILGFPLTLLLTHVRACRSSQVSILNGSGSEAYLNALEAHRRKKPKIIVLLVGNFRVLFALLVFVELSFAFSGYYPGVLEKSSYFTPVNKVVMLRGYTADETGIMKVDKGAQHYVENYISEGKQTFRVFTEIDLLKKDAHVTPHIIGRDYLEIQNPSYSNPFSEFIHTIKGQATTNLLEKEYLHYSKSPINDDGFRSIAFKNHQTSRTKVLLLGDSFTWGKTLDQITNSFADLLAAKKYAVYNSGITGTDLPQYAGVAEKYTQKIRPDYVVVNLYAGNDFSTYDRPLKPYVPTYFSTNAGNLMSSPRGEYFNSGQEAYDNLLSINSIPAQLSVFNWLASRTRIGTQLWRGMQNLGLLNNERTKKTARYLARTDKLEVGNSINKVYLEKIIETCKKNNCRVIISIIPTSDDLTCTNGAPLELMLEGFTYFIIKTLTPDDYASDGHFNKSGHKKYADFLEDIISLEDNN